MRTFSPGPWRNDFPQVRDATGRLVCNVAHAGTHNGNECLITEAPELLAFARRVGYEPVGHAEASAREILDQLTATARALVARIEGKSL